MLFPRGRQGLIERMSRRMDTLLRTAQAANRALCFVVVIPACVEDEHDDEDAGEVQSQARQSWGMLYVGPAAGRGRWSRH